MGRLAKRQFRKSASHLISSAWLSFRRTFNTQTGSEHMGEMLQLPSFC